VNREAERLLVSILAVGAIAALFLLRAFDDNRLTSWQWVFAGTNPTRLYVLAAAGVGLANLLARFTLPARSPAVLFLLACAAAASFWGEPEVIVDAARYFAEAKYLEVHGLGRFLTEWGRELPAWTDLPLVPLLYGLLFRLFGEYRICVQALTTLLFAGSVVLTHGVGKALWHDEVGFMAGALLLAIPYLLTQVPGMLVDIPTMFFLSLAVFTVIRALRHGGTGRILLASLAVSLTCFTKYSSWLMLSVLPVAAMVYRRAGAPRPLRTASAIGLFAGSLVSAAVLVRRDVWSEQLALLVGYQAPGLRRWGESLASTFLFQVHPFLTIAALLSVWLAVRRRDPKYAIVAWPVLLLLVLQVRRTRYWIPAFPMLALMGAYGLQAIRTGELRRLVVGCAVASSLVVAGYGYLPFLRSTSAMNLKKAGEYLDSIDEKRVEVFTLPQDSDVNPAVSVPILDLFTAKELVYGDNGAARSSKGRSADSALRFTWDYKSPGYYAAGGTEGGSAVVVISGDAGQVLPEHVANRLKGHRLVAVFAADEGVFRHRTLVSVYRAAAAMPRRTPHHPGLAHIPRRSRRESSPAVRRCRTDA